MRSIVTLRNDSGRPRRLPTLLPAGRPRRNQWIGGLALLLVAAATCRTAPAAAQQDAPAANRNADEVSVFVNGIREQDDIVLVDVRRLGSCCDPERLARRVRIEAYQHTDRGPRRRWQDTDLASITQAAPSISTVVFVHGNRISPWDAKCEGLAAYRRIVRQSRSAMPIRFVIFSWPSSEIGGLLKDVRVKAARTGPAGCQLAWFVDQLPADTPVSLVGFSFGARIITGGLHILGGGTIGRCGLDELRHADRAPMNVVLLAAALHADWLSPGHYHGQAMTRVDQMLLVNNSQDRAMRFYHFVTRRGHPQALGLCGPTCIDPDGASKITQRHVGRYVGSEHNVFCYLSPPGVTGQIWDHASLAVETAAR